MDTLSPEIILLIAEQLYGSGTVSDIANVSRFSKVNSTMFKFAAQFMYHAIPASRLRSPELLFTLKHNPKYGERVKSVTWVLGEMQQTDSGPMLSNVMEQARIPFAIMQYCHRVQRIAFCLAAPQEVAMLGGYNQPFLGSQLCSLPAVQSIKEITIFNGDKSLDAKPPSFDSLYQFLCFLPKLEKILLKDVALPTPGELAHLPSPSLSTFVFSVKQHGQIDNLHHLLSYSTSTLTEFCFSAALVSPVDLIQSLSDQRGERLRFPAVKTIKVSALAMTTFVAMADWLKLLNSFPNAGRLILGFTGQFCQATGYLEELASALTEARCGPGLTEICIQTDLSLRAAPFFGIFAAARHCPNLRCLYLNATNYHSEELRGLLFNQGCCEAPTPKMFQMFAQTLIRAELSLLYVYLVHNET